MKGHAVWIVAWFLDNMLAVGVGGYLGYRFGHKAEAWLQAAWGQAGNVFGKFSR